MFNKNKKRIEKLEEEIRELKHSVYEGKMYSYTPFSCLSFTRTPTISMREAVQAILDGMDLKLIREPGTPSKVVADIKIPDKKTEEKDNAQTEG